MDKAKLILTDKTTNARAFEILKQLSSGVDELRVNLKHAKPAKRGQQLFADYQLTVQGDTDSSANRERREALLKGLLWPLFDSKDPKRGFSPEQRRLIFNSDDQPKCAACAKAIGWNDFTIDHVKAWSKGGSSGLGNAQLMHRSCNSRKGSR